MACKIVELPRCPVCGCNSCDCGAREYHDAVVRLKAENKKLKAMQEVSDKAYKAIEAEIEKPTKELDKLLELANYVTAFIDITPSHKLYDSVRCDIKRCLRQLKGGE